MTLLELGVGNLHSLAKAFARALPGAAVREAGPDALDTLGQDELLVLPGVGAFAPAAAALAPHRAALRGALDRGLPLVGICLGMQLLFERSEEGEGEGLALFAGEVTRLATPRVPHMGWSRVQARRPDLALPGAVYFAHSFACRPREPEIVLAESACDGDHFPAMVGRGRVVGFQFHPEKSSDEGVALLARVTEGLLA